MGSRLFLWIWYEDYCAWKPLDSITLPDSLNQNLGGKSGSSAEAEMQKEREDGEGEGRKTCPELHHREKGSGSVTHGA